MAKIIKGADAKKTGSVRSSERTKDLPDSGGVIHKRVMDAKLQAAKIIADAEGEGSKIREEARHVLENAKAEREVAIKRGYAEGESKGLAQVTEKLIKLDRLKEEFYGSAEPEVIKLVMAIAEKVIGKMVSENADAIKSVVHQALEKAIGDRITIKLNPADLKKIVSDDQEFKDAMDRTKRLVFREDESISKGGCVVETEVGTIDARMETQIAAVKKALKF